MYYINKGYFQILRRKTSIFSPKTFCYIFCYYIIHSTCIFYFQEVFFLYYTVKFCVPTKNIFIFESSEILPLKKVFKIGLPLWSSIELQSVRLKHIWGKYILFYIYLPFAKKQDLCSTLNWQVGTHIYINRISQHTGAKSMHTNLQPLLFQKHFLYIFCHQWTLILSPKKNVLITNDF